MCFVDPTGLYDITYDDDITDKEQKSVEKAIINAKGEIEKSLDQLEKLKSIVSPRRSEKLDKINTLVDLLTQSLGDINSNDIGLHISKKDRGKEDTGAEYQNHFVDPNNGKIGILQATINTFTRGRVEAGLDVYRLELNSNEERGFWANDEYGQGKIMMHEVLHPAGADDNYANSGWYKSAPQISNYYGDSLEFGRRNCYFFFEDLGKWK